MSQHLDSMPSRNELKPFLLDVTDKAYTSGSADNIPCGIYRVYAAATNIPVSDPGYCSTYERENGTKLQTYITDSNRTFTRTKVNGTWTSWQELALNGKIPKIETISNITTDSAGMYISNYDMDKVVSAYIATSTQLFVLIRPSTAGKAVMYVYQYNGSTLVPKPNETVSINVWVIE